MGLAEQVEQLNEENAALRVEVGELRAKLDALEAELEKLRRERGRDSSNSGKPPSSDTLGQRATQANSGSRVPNAVVKHANRPRSSSLNGKWPPGKQPGAPGRTVKVERPDRGRSPIPPGAAPVRATPGRRRGHRDRGPPGLRPARPGLEVTEHQAQSRRCSCGAPTKADFPAEAKVPANYGPVVRVVAVYLMVGQHFPVARTAALLAQVCGAPVSTGWLTGLPAEASAAWRRSSTSPGRTDGGRRPARRRDRVSHIRRPLLVPRRLQRPADPARLPPETWRRALEDMAVLPFFKGVLVSDGWKPYWSVQGVEHALCCAHLLRDLASLSGSPAHREWADEMADLLVEAKEAVERLRHTAALASVPAS